MCVCVYVRVYAYVCVCVCVWCGCLCVGAQHERASNAMHARVENYDELSFFESMIMDVPREKGKSA